ncbi:MAG: hypothetical protein HYU41_23580 [Candidatus Rokubacteria bacterium]|nr:hypothetical protein [Candidatus Rokubacteria bacterium]
MSAAGRFATRRIVDDPADRPYRAPTHGHQRRLRLRRRHRSPPRRRRGTRRDQPRRDVPRPARLARELRRARRPGADPHPPRRDRRRARARLRESQGAADGGGGPRHRRPPAREHGDVQRVLRSRADVRRFEPSTPPHPDPRAIDDAARRLVEARFPLIVVENLGRRSEATAPLCRLAEVLAAPLVDLAVEYQGRPSVPSSHPLDMSGARQEVVAEADVVLALDVTSFLGALGQTDRSTREVRWLNESSRIIAISLDDYAFRSWAHTFQSLAPVDLPIAADAALALPALLAAVEDRLKRDARAADRQARAQRIAARHAAVQAEWRAAVALERSSKPVAPSVLAAEVWNVIKDEDWVLANGTGKGWARRLWDWRPERTYGGSGGAGLGYGLPAALGVTLAHRGSGKICVNLQADGDMLYVANGLYTAAHHRLPLLTVMFNNRTYGNDEEHQEAVAKTRGRPVENKVIGIRIDDPAPDFAKIAQGFGVHAEGPVDSADAIGPALRRALRVVKDEGRPALVDVLTRL